MEKWAVNRLSIELKRDRRALTRLIAEKDIEPVEIAGRSKFYHLADVVNAMIDGEELNLQQERAKLARKQEEKTSLQVEQIKGTLVDADLVKSEWQKYIAGCRAKLLSLPSKIAGNIMAAESMQEVQELLKTEIYQALNELAGKS